MPFKYYKNLNPRDKRIYQQSDAIAQVPLEQTHSLRTCVGALEKTLQAGDRKATETNCNELVRIASAGLNIRRARVTVLARRPSHDWGELHGLYEPAEARTPGHITVWMRTAKRRQVVAFRTFLRTLIHELCHHLDYELFKLADSFHTEGFYKRENDVYKKLLPRHPPTHQFELPFAD